MGLRLMVKALPASFSSSEERNPPGGEQNEVSQMGYGSQRKTSNIRSNKDYKSWINSGTERRKGRRRDRNRKKNKAERKQVKAKKKKKKKKRGEKKKKKKKKKKS